MKEYSKDEITKFFKSKANPALEEFGAELEEREWKVEDIQIHNPDFRWIGNTLTSKIELSQGRKRCFSYKILAKPSESTSDSYNLEFKYGWCFDDNAGTRDFPDKYDPDINILAKDELIEHIKKRFDEHVGMK